jgi:arabinose-5-phosphate isomerase
MLCSQCSTRCDELNICYNPACSRNTTAKLQRYSSQLVSAEESLTACIHALVSILRGREGCVFLTGIGKSAHSVKKCVATWQSLGLLCHSLLVQDMLHGDIGVLKPGDTIIYISNSGNTEELLAVSSYVRKTFPVCQICITNNPSALLSTTVDHALNLCNFKIREADTLNMAPTVSCVLFMLVLDIVGVHLAEGRDITREDFQRNHPGGALGKIK